MTRKKTSQAKAPPQRRRAKITCAEKLIGLMRSEGGASAAELAAAVGWQLHSVRGFIAGTLKKRSDLSVRATKVDAFTRYRVVDASEPEA